MRLLRVQSHAEVDNVGYGMNVKVLLTPLGVLILLSAVRRGFTFGFYSSRFTMWYPNFVFTGGEVCPF
jgi:hypothetical protein